MAVLVDGPPGFRASLGTLPAGALVTDRRPGRFQLAAWFVRSGISAPAYDRRQLA